MASLSDAPIIGIFSHTGFQDAADGASHQALSYLAMTSSIPHVKVFALSTSQEAHHLIGQAIEEFKHNQEHGQNVSYIFFLGRENFPASYMEKPAYDLEQAQVLFDTANKYESGVTIVTHGSLVGEALKAAKQLESKGTGAVVINSPCINHPDLKTIKHALEKTGHRLIVVEDHQYIGGFGQILAHALVHEKSVAKAGLHMETLAVDGHFGQSSYTALALYKKHGLDSESIVQAAHSLTTVN